MDDELQLWTVRAFDRASASVTLPPRERWIPRRRRRALAVSPILVGIAALALLAIGLGGLPDLQRFTPAAPGGPLLPARASTLQPVAAEDDTWGRAWAFAQPVTVLRPTLLPRDPGHDAFDGMTTSRGPVYYVVSYSPLGTQGLDPRVRQLVFIAETREITGSETRLIVAGERAEVVTVRRQSAELVENASGAMQVSWFEDGVHYAVQASKLTREELLAIANSLRPVVDARGATR